MNMTEQFDEFIDSYFLDANGIIYSEIDAKTLAPLGKAFFDRFSDAAGDELGSEATWGPDHFTATDFWLYENCGMTTGSYLNSLCCALRTPGGDTPDIRRRAKRSFNALKYIYSIGETLEKGFFPKIWGNKLSHQTSTDQCLYAVHSMYNYYPFATAEEQNEIAEITVNIADYWYRRKYILTYYKIKDMVWPPLRFPPLLMLAWKCSGNEEYRREALRILEEHRAEVPEYLVRDNYIYASADCMTMDTMNIELMTEYAPLPEEWRALMQEGLKKEWSQRKQTLTPDGYYWSGLNFDLNANKVIYDDTCRPRSAWSTMIVRAGLEISRYFPELYPEAKAAAEIVLNQLKPEDMVYYRLEDIGMFKPEQQYKMHFLSGDAIANRQWAARLLVELEATMQH